MSTRPSATENCPAASVAALFSGGRDSSLAVARLALRGEIVQPLHFITGTGVPSDLPHIREHELRRTFPDHVLSAVMLPAYGLIRRVAIASIEDDFARFGGKNLILLGEMLALLSVGIRYCVNESIPSLAFGATSYQSEMPEQRPVAVDFFTQLATSYGVRLLTPVVDCASADEVKYELWDIGISTKSLEGMSIFSDSFSFASDSLVLSYLEGKRAICDDFLGRVLPLREPESP